MVVDTVNGARNKGVLTCAFCKGSGADPFELLSDQSICQVCGGRGRVRIRTPFTECAYCRGTGVHLHRRLVCTVCGGKGVVEVRRMTTTCPDCGGIGRVAGQYLPCLTCGGKGVLISRSQASAQ